MNFTLDVPSAPTNVHLVVTGSDNITVTFDEPLRSNGAMIIKYKIEWSTDEFFTNLSSDVIKSCFLREYIIRNLTVGQKCYVRVSASNMKGFGETNVANPPYCTPSNWREFSKTSRTNICDLRFEEIQNKIFNEREGNGMNRSLDGNESSDTPSRRNYRRSYGNLRRNFRQLFQFYPRLAKSIKRGLYLVSVMINSDRILVTNEDVLPMVEVDENYGHNLLTDFQWFMKLTFVWEDLKSVRPNLERCSSATSFYLRMKIVQAAIELQTLEEINNLGRLHHAYIRDNEGNVAFVLINDLSSDTRTNVSPSNLKWMAMTKFFELMKESSSLTTNSCLQQIIDKLPDMIDSYHASMRSLDPGLYVAYLKMQNSVDSIRVMVNKHMPGSLPCTKIRSVANVSKEEWKWLHTNNNENSSEDESLDNSLELFKTQFFDAAKQLFVMLDLPETHFSNSRIYDSQVVEIRDDLSLIILMSTADEVNILSSPSNHSLASFIYLPVYIFERTLSSSNRFLSSHLTFHEHQVISIKISDTIRDHSSIISLLFNRHKFSNLKSCKLLSINSMTRLCNIIKQIESLNTLVIFQIVQPDRPDLNKNDNDEFTRMILTHKSSSLRSVMLRYPYHYLNISNYTSIASNIISLTLRIAGSYPTVSIDSVLRVFCLCHKIRYLCIILYNDKRFKNNNINVSNDLSPMNENSLPILSQLTSFALIIDT
ncbi:unnamed protein product [Rotaria magnacalcarata]|uniref:Fibronectin type-III domain-containing protein n=2 Tax=Rotaria magnacalcarata TaxID=392030 RepID=A0A816LTF1_9BILA|nr:unnamed protein product [Rotaria magnacalcarata]